MSEKNLSTDEVEAIRSSMSGIMRDLPEFSGGVLPGAQRDIEQTGWSCDTEGYIRLHDDIETAVREYVCDIIDVTHDTELTVIRWEPVVITRKDCGSPLEYYLLERLNDEFLPDELDPEITPAMKAAEDVFIAAVLAEYKPRALTRVEEVVVRVGDYYKEEV